MVVDDQGSLGLSGKSICRVCSAPRRGSGTRRHSQALQKLAYGPTNAGKGRLLTSQALRLRLLLPNCLPANWSIFYGGSIVPAESTGAALDPVTPPTTHLPLLPI